LPKKNIDNIGAGFVWIVHLAVAPAGDQLVDAIAVEVEADDGSGAVLRLDAPPPEKNIFENTVNVPYLLLPIHFWGHYLIYKCPENADDANIHKSTAMIFN
jgi:hypothetical protein